MLRQSWILLFCCVLLAGCANRTPPLEAPNIRIVELTMSQPGDPVSQSYELIVRIKNTSEVELVVNSYEFELILDGRSAGVHSAQVELSVPVLSNENIRATGQLNPVQAQALLSLQTGSRRQLPYTLKGVLTSQGRLFEVAYDGWLHRSPGKKGSFR